MVKFEDKYPRPANVWWSGERDMYIGVSSNHKETKDYQKLYEQWLRGELIE